MSRCADCGVEAQDESLFRPFYPSVSAPALHYCATCWERREARTQRQGLQFTAGLLVAAALVALVFELGTGSAFARVCLWIVVFNVVGTVLHELGHAGVALALGLRLRTISFGYGLVLYSREIGSTTLQLRSVPVCGHVTVAGRKRSFPRLREVLVCLGGPGTNAVLALIAWQVGVGQLPDTELAITDVTSWQIMFAVNATIVVFNLVPYAFPDPSDTSAKWQPNDGLLSIKSLFASQETIDGWASVAVSWEASDLMRRGDLAGARQLVDAEALARPGARRLQLLQGKVRLAAEEWDAAAPIFEAVAATGGSDDLRADALAGLSAICAVRGQSGLAETHARNALELDPTSLVARLQHGRALLARGFVAKAEAAFDAVLAASDDPAMRANAACGAAGARLEAGDPDGCRRQLELARSLDPNCTAIEAVEKALDP